MNLGFKMKETMEGFHSFRTSGFSDIRRPFRFDVDWGASNFTDFLNPKNPNFMEAYLKGTVTMDDWVDSAPCEGILTLDYLNSHTITYEFEFKRWDGRQSETFRFFGQKKNIKPWNLHRTHTTCYGEVRNVKTGELISESTTYFKLRKIIPFLLSFRLKI